MESLNEETDFYYVNSFQFAADNDENILAKCEYGQVFSAIIGKDNIYGFQFHPEKSQKVGQRLINNFLNIT